MVADAISRLSTLGLYQGKNNEKNQLLLEDAIENILEEIQSIESTTEVPGNTKINKLNLNLLRKEQLQDRFC